MPTFMLPINTNECEEGHEDGDANFHTPVGRTRPTGFFCGFTHYVLD